MSKNPYIDLALFPDVVYSENRPPPAIQYPDPFGKEFMGIKLDYDWCELSKADNLPIPPPEAREGYADDFHYFIASSSDYIQVNRCVEDFDLKLNETSKVLDFGCGTRRFIRALQNHYPSISIYGCDLNRNHVEWCNQYLDAMVIQNTIIPHLPYADHTFDLITAFSIFTHIDEFELTWLAELSRILKPGGIAYLTVLTDETWNSVDENSPIYCHLKSRNDVKYTEEVKPLLFRRPMATDKAVFKYSNRSVYSCDVFLSKKRIYDLWGQYLNILEISPHRHDYQDVVIATKI